jgi:hypothetical protein
MKFTIEASVLGNGQYRLQDDKSWRYLNNRDIRPNDLTYPDLASTRRFIDPVDTVNLGNCLYKVNPKTSSLEDKVAFISQRLSRDKPPREFTEDELKSVIAFGDDSKNNTLILDLEGNFALTDLSYAMGPYNPVAVRRETFCAR